MASDDATATLASVVLEVSARAASASPLPRGLPHLGLDHPSPTSLSVLEGLSRHGIFRKYVQVLDLAGGLGAAARWAAESLSCRVVSTAPTRRVALAAGRLTARARLGEAVAHLAAAAEALPIRDAAFTHVWAIESLSRLTALAPALAEAQRVVRPGGHLAVQELVSVEASALVGDRQLRAQGWWLEQVRAAGFVDVVVHDVSAVADQVGPRVLAAREQLRDRLVRRDDTALTRHVSEISAIASACASGRVRIVQVFGRRP